MADDTPEVSAKVEEPPSKKRAQEMVTKEAGPTAPASGRRPSFREIRRQLNEEELKQAGVQKLLIEDFEGAETECETLRLYVEKYHEADKEVARLAEKLKTNIAFENLTGVGFAGGGAIVSLAPSVWAMSTVKGIAAVGVGLLFIIGSTGARIVQCRK